MEDLYQANSSSRISSVFKGPILAVFKLAIQTEKTHALGPNIGIVAGVLFKMYLWLQVPRIFWVWCNALGCLVTVLLVLAVSYTIKRKVNEGLEVVYYSGKKEVAILVGYFITIVLFSLYLPNLLD